MADSNQDHEKLRGFAVLINSILLPLNEKKGFKEKFGKVNVKILLNASNLNHAAIIIVNKGFVKVESILNKPKENLNKKKNRVECFFRDGHPNFPRHCYESTIVAWSCENVANS